MEAIKGTFAGSVCSKGGEKVNADTLFGKGKVLGLYFSAHWCPPCRAFTPELAKWYTNFKSTPNGSNFEIVFVSSDRDEEGFKDYFKDMPWLALTYSERDKKAQLSKKYKVQGIPTFVLLNAETGSIITKEGRSIPEDDPTGAQFPWAPKSFNDMIQGKLINNSGKELNTSDVAGNVMGIYFSAHWCPPCKAFTPVLAKTYEKLKAKNPKFEIIFASSDRSEESFKEYFKTMPWLAFPYNDARIKLVSKLYGISGIPSLVIVDEAGKVITESGREAVKADPEGKDFPWYPKPLTELTDAAAGKLNEDACLILFTEGAEDSEKFTNTLLLDVAKEHHAKGDEQSLFFYWGGEDEFCDTVRDYAKLPDTVPLLVILDVPEAKQYQFGKGELTAENARAFINDFVNKKLTGKALRS